jgi:2-desacetyl-2-hydroxyethyl bacteriochlorophyllide A dehydrogenase
VEIREVDLPQLGEGQLLVASRYSGISAGTELLAYRGEVDPSLPLDETLGALAGSFRYPFPYGYSAVGVVEESRSGVPPGSLVFAFHPHQDRFVVDATDAVRVDPVDARTATLFPVVETALQVSLDTGAGLGDVVAVIGLGPVGAVTSVLLSRSGARVIGCDRRQEARAAGATLAVDPVAPEELESRVREATDGNGCDVVVEASGDPAALGPALELLRHEGTALVCSWYGTKLVPLPLGGAFHRRRLVIRSSQVSTIPAALSSKWSRERRRAETRRLLAELPLEALTTHEFPFDGAAEAYEAIDRGRDGVLHAALWYG